MLTPQHPFLQALHDLRPNALVRVALLGSALTLALALGACGRGGNSSGTRAPARSGEVWEIDRAAGRPAMPGAVLAYVNGLHLIVVDGNEIYAGMTSLKAEARSDGGRAIKLSNGLEAVLTPAGDDRMRLSFSTGEAVDLCRKTEERK